jgi:hypothetical protein
MSIDDRNRLGNYRRPRSPAGLVTLRKDRSDCSRRAPILPDYEWCRLPWAKRTELRATVPLLLLSRMEQTGGR